MKAIVWFFIGMCWMMHEKSFSQKDDVYSGKPDTAFQKKNTREKNPSSIAKRLVYSGNISLFYSNGWYIFLNPRVGIIPDNKKIFVIGGGPAFNYWQIRNFTPFYQYGPMAFGMINITSGFYLAGEYFLLNQEDWASSWNPYRRIWVPYSFAGIGYRSMMGERISSYITFLINLTPHRSSVLSNPFIQIGFITGL